MADGRKKVHPRVRTILQVNVYVCVLLDVRTRPENENIYYLWKAFDMNSSVVGHAGRLLCRKKNTGLDSSILLVRVLRGNFRLRVLTIVLQFEYKVTNILDKPTETFFGYISILAGLLDFELKLT